MTQPATPGSISTFDPRNGAVVGSVDAATPADVAAALDRAHKAFGPWSETSHTERAHHIRELRRRLLDSMDHVADALSSATGRSHRDSLMIEVAPAANAARWVEKHAASELAPRRASTGVMIHKKAWVRHVPRGVVGVITPWNYPFFLAWNPMIHAIAAGCTVVVKPSEMTATVGEVLARLVGSAGLPEGVVEVLHGGVEVGEAIVGGVDMLSFTGSPVTGRRVAAAAAERLVPTVLELGGKDAMVVLDDADLRRAARAAVWGAMVNAGQTCVAVERVYAVSSIHDRFLNEVLELVDSLSAGTGDATDIGPITHPNQVTVIERHLAEATAAGARIVRGGGSRDAALGCAWIEPTVVIDVDHTMAMMREETFGPVLAVMRVPDEATALELANDSTFGLHGSVWSKDEQRALNFAKRMRTGSVAVNDVIANIYIPSLPFGGVGESGYGSNVGPEGLRAYCYQQTITSNRFTLPREVWWYPRQFGSRGWKRIIRVTAGR